MQHTKVSEVQCFLRSLVIERCHPLDWKGTHRTTDTPLVFSRHPNGSRQGYCWAHIPSIRDKTHGRALHLDERMPWAATRAGHLEKSFNTDTGSVYFIFKPAVKWHLDKSILHYATDWMSLSFMLFQEVFYPTDAFLSKNALEEENLASQCKNPLL